jgi:CheY-like chemotaxis protein
LQLFRPRPDQATGEGDLSRGAAGGGERCWGAVAPGEDDVGGEARMAILLVEDNPDHEELIRRALDERHAEVSLRVARHGEDALDYLFRRGAWADESTSPRPKLVLLDLRLPRVDGIQVLGIIKSTPSLRDIPVVILTTSDSEQDMARAYARHANSYLVKPVDHQRFADLVASIERYWLEMNRQPPAAAAS